MIEQSSAPTLVAIVQGHVALGQIAEDPSVRFKISRAGQETIVFMGRLDNRSSLCADLAGASGDVPELPDRALVGLAYARWGIDCADRLLGDWAFALWDGNLDRLLVARDPCGRANLYYSYDGTRGRLAFSSRLKGILSLPGFARDLDPDYFAQYTPGIPRNAATPYLGIQRLTPGHLLILEKGHFEVRRYWDVNSLPEVRLPSDEAYLERFLEIFGESVRCSTLDDCPTGAFLSGGLDSGAVTLLAARELAARGKPFPVFSYVPRYPFAGYVPSFRRGAETDLINATAACADNMHLSLLDGSGVSILEGIQTFLTHVDEPLFGPSNAYWNLAILRRAKDMGIQRLLTGQAGNSTISYAGDRRELYSGLKKRGSWGNICLEAICSLWQRLQSPGRVSGQPSIDRTGVDGTAAEASARKRSPVNPRFLSDHLAKRSRNRVELPSTNYASHQAFAFHKYMRQGAFTIAWNLHAAWGIEGRDPTLDRRVVEFCLGIPRDQYFRRGQHRMLVRRAMNGIMPPTVLGNRRRGMQSADIVRRVLNERDSIDDVLRRLEASPLAGHYLHLSAMRSVLDGLDSREADPAVTFDTNALLLPGLMIGLFLLEHEGQKVC